MGSKLTVRQVAERYNKSLYQVNYAIVQGKLKAQKYGYNWLIEEDDLPTLWPVEGRGRPRKNKGVK